MWGNKWQVFICIFFIHALAAEMGGPAVAQEIQKFTGEMQFADDSVDERQGRLNRYLQLRTAGLDTLSYMYQALSRQLLKSIDDHGGTLLTAVANFWVGQYNTCEQIGRYIRSVNVQTETDARTNAAIRELLIRSYVIRILDKGEKINYHAALRRVPSELNEWLQNARESLKHPDMPLIQEPDEP